MTEHEQEMSGSKPNDDVETQGAESATPGESADEASGAQGAADAPGGADRGEEWAPLFGPDQAEGFRQRWEELQVGFVDRPQQVVEQADDLVSQLMQQLTAGFRERRSQLEAQWSRGDEVSTEDLRVALTRYRSFFNRLLSA